MTIGMSSSGKGGSSPASIMSAIPARPHPPHPGRRPHESDHQQHLRPEPFPARRGRCPRRRRQSRWCSTVDKLMDDNARQKVGNPPRGSANVAIGCYSVYDRDPYRRQPRPSIFHGDVSIRPADRAGGTSNARNAGCESCAGFPFCDTKSFSVFASDVADCRPVLEQAARIVLRLTARNAVPAT